MSGPQHLLSLEGRLIVSCQADEHDAFYAHMDLFARAAVSGGAAGIRANGVEDVRSIRAAVSVPIIGIHKVKQQDGKVLITPSFESAEQLVTAGAAAVALDCTARGQQHGALPRIRRIKEELGVPVMADIATLQEALAAAEAGADFVLSTMRGYTDDTADVQAFDPEFIRHLVQAVSVPVIAEGRVDTPKLAREAIEAGAFAVVTGTVITRPHVVVRRFADAVAAARPASLPRHAIAIDLGGTNTKYGIASSHGKLLWQDTQPTPAKGGQRALLQHLQSITRLALERAAGMNVRAEMIGIATAGWVNPKKGRVVYATDNLPGWTGADISGALAVVTNLPVFVENDANALAVGEHQFGRASNWKNFVCITLGTGVGGGCYIGGCLNRGAHFFANALGHISIAIHGRPCNCGQSGCLEAYTNAAALLEYAKGKYADAEALIAAAQTGEQTAMNAVEQLAHYLAQGCTLLLQLLDPEALILAGGLVQNNPLLIDSLKEELRTMAPNWERRKLEVCASTLGYHAGVLGAAAVAFESIT